MATGTELPRVPPKEKLSFEEYLDWCDEDTWAEWVDGEVIMVSPASARHQEVGSFLEKVLGIYVEAHHLGSLFRAPFVMRLAARPSGREPDLIFISRDRAQLIKSNYLDGPADLAIEVVSPESIGRDRGEKFVEYERAGIKEYWLIDPDRQSAEFYELTAEGRYRVGAIESGVYRSRIIAGFWLRVDWLWQSPPPPTLTVLRQLKIL
jgi:Uma2 family endonuclease